MNIENIKEYLDKGIHHYEKEINKLDVKSERSTKYNYNKGALDALNNMLVFLNQPEKKEEKVKFNQIKYVDFAGIIPTYFEYPLEVYKTFVENPNNYISIGDEVVGKCAVNIMNNIIYLKGIIKDIYPKEGFTNIKLAVDKKDNTYTYKFELGEGDNNFSLTK